jgi:hypothetical protein
MNFIKITMDLSKDNEHNEDKELFSIDYSKENNKVIEIIINRLTK